MAGELCSRDAPPFWSQVAEMVGRPSRLPGGRVADGRTPTTRRLLERRHLAHVLPPTLQREALRLALKFAGETTSDATIEQILDELNHPPNSQTATADA